MLFSVKEALRGRPVWVRAGHDVFYYRNAYRRPARHPTNKRQVGQCHSSRGHGS